MRKIMFSGFAALLALVAVGTSIGSWATATTWSQNPSNRAEGVSVNTFEMMKNAKDLPAEQFDLS